VSTRVSLGGHEARVDRPVINGSITQGTVGIKQTNKQITQSAVPSGSDCPSGGTYGGPASRKKADADERKRPENVKYVIFIVGISDNIARASRILDN